MEKTNIDFIPLNIKKVLMEDGCRLIGLIRSGFWPDEGTPFSCMLSIPEWAYEDLDSDSLYLKKMRNPPLLGMVGKWSPNVISRFTKIIPRNINGVALNFTKNEKGTWVAPILERDSRLLHYIIFGEYSLKFIEGAHPGTMEKAKELGNIL